MVDDDELEKLREQKKEELESEGQEEARERQREQIKNMAKQYLSQDARERLNNLRMAKPDIAASVEQQIVQLGNSGRVDTIGDEQLKSILKEVQSSGKDRDIKFRR